LLGIEIWNFSFCFIWVIMFSFNFFFVIKYWKDIFMWFWQALFLSWSLYIYFFSLVYLLSLPIFQSYY
jgi:hypothetical protein